MSLAVAAAAGAAALLYSFVIAGLVRQWLTDPAASYGLLVVAAAALLAVRRRHVVAATPLRPASAGFAVTAVAMAIYAIGSLAGDVFVMRVSLPIALTGLLLVAAGPGRTRALAAPLALCAVAIPLPAVIVTSLTMPLQLVSSQIAADVLRASSLNVVQQGNVLVLDAITLEVAEACSGLQSLLSLGAMAAVMAALVPMNRWGRGLMFAAVVPIAIIGNGLRVAMTGILTTWFGEVAVRGLVHEMTGYAAFLAMCAGIFGLLRLGRFSTASVAS